jgi:hypothetical protein
MHKVILPVTIVTVTFPLTCNPNAEAFAVAFALAELTIIVARTRIDKDQISSPVSFSSLPLSFIRGAAGKTKSSEPYLMVIFYGIARKIP